MLTLWVFDLTAIGLGLAGSIFFTIGLHGFKPAHIDEHFIAGALKLGQVAAFVMLAGGLVHLLLGFPSMTYGPPGFDGLLR